LKYLVNNRLFVTVYDVTLFRLTQEEESRIEHERDIRNQLGRQAAAHSDHLRDVLHVQKRELQAAYDVFVATRLDEERSSFQKYIIGWIARMRGIDKALAGMLNVSMS
jgi:MICOS complex subunit MIC60